MKSLNGRSLVFRCCALLFVLLGMLLVAGCAGKTSSLPVRPEELPYESVKYDPPTPLEWKLENGLTVLFLQDSELPLVSGSLFIPGGSYWEEKLGVASVMGSQMRAGGAGQLSPQQLDETLVEMAAGISSGFGDEYGTFGFGCLSADIDRLFPLFADVLLRPRFDDGRLELWRGQALESIRRRKDDPNTVVSVSMSEILFGDNVYGRVSDIRDVASIDRLDLLRAHREFVRPNGAYLVLSGDLTRAKAEALVSKYLGEWSPRESELGPPPQFTYTPSPGIYFIEKPLQQANILVSELGPTRHSPDRYDIEVFNQIFGTAGFDSRLMQRVRTQLGLVYGIYGGISAGRVVGQNYIGMQTKSESAGLALGESLRILQGLQEEPAREEELAIVKQAAQSAFVFKFASTEQVVRRQALLRLLEYPEDFDQTFLDRIFAVNQAGVERVANTRWDLSQLVIVVVGDKTAFESVARLVADPESVLHGYPFRTVQFENRVKLS
ncbi:MAG: insulinase family protein [Bdellovibrionales bacterium]|nr:insulinase family protein [Bdellovibrionales bacterium]